MTLSPHSSRLSFLPIQCGSLLFRCPLLFPPVISAAPCSLPRQRTVGGHMSTSMVCEVKYFQEKMCCVAWWGWGQVQSPDRPPELQFWSPPAISVPAATALLFVSPGAPVHSPPLEDRTAASSSLLSFPHHFLQGWELQKTLKKEYTGVGDSALDSVPEARFFPGPSSLLLWGPPHSLVSRACVCFAKQAPVNQGQTISRSSGAASGSGGW